MKTFLMAMSLILPWPLRRRLLGRAFGYEIHPTARIGLSWVMPRRLVMEAHSYIGNLTICKNLGLIHLREHAFVGNGNWVTGYPPGSSRHFSHQSDRRPELILGRHAAITNRHLIDCTAAVSIGAYSTFAGFSSQILTHSVDLAASRQAASPVTIGEYCFVGTNSVLLGGCVLPDRSVLGAKSLLNKVFKETGTLYAGVPAKPVSALPVEQMAYFRRETGFVD